MMRRAIGMMDQMRDVPVRHGFVRQIGILRAQIRQPLALQPFLERIGVARTDDIAADARIVFQNETTFRLQHAIGRGIDLAQELRIAIKRRRVLPGIAGLQADFAKRIEIVGAKAAQRIRHTDSRGSPSRRACRSRACAATRCERPDRLRCVVHRAKCIRTCRCSRP